MRARVTVRLMTARATTVRVKSAKVAARVATMRLIASMIADVTVLNGNGLKGYGIAVGMRALTKRITQPWYIQAAGAGSFTAPIGGLRTVPQSEAHTNTTPMKAFDKEASCISKRDQYHITPDLGDAWHLDPTPTRQYGSTSHLSPDYRPTPERLYSESPAMNQRLHFWLDHW